MQIDTFKEKMKSFFSVLGSMPDKKVIKTMKLIDEHYKSDSPVLDMTDSLFSIDYSKETVTVNGYLVKFMGEFEFGNVDEHETNNLLN
ncbi:MAG: hypothetical protein K6E20_05645 [Acholeplasmatales bacterium]|nr:hypothetical protein [Acholeplasmatales bacterium]